MTGQASGHWEKPVVEQLKEGIIHAVVPEPQEEHAIQVGPVLQAEGSQGGDPLCLPNASSYESIKEDCVCYQNGWGAAPPSQNYLQGFELKLVCVQQFMIGAGRTHVISRSRRIDSVHSKFASSQAAFNLTFVGALGV